MGAAVGLIAEHPPTGPGQADQLRDHGGGVGNRDQQQPGVHEIKRACWQPGVPGVSLHNVNVRKPALVDELSRLRDVLSVEVQPSHAPGHANPF